LSDRVAERAAFVVRNLQRARRRKRGERVEPGTPGRKQYSTHGLEHAVVRQRFGQLTLGGAEREQGQVVALRELSGKPMDPQPVAADRRIGIPGGEYEDAST